ncbi:MAG: hypothetical protein HOA57_00840 [Candidatus Magasanikbacteria bacterium]|jgi:nicotinate phosphoribosyltransferase|nr:hypothetical protein [Candidatus Magasanikbacteria bacterium]MBT4314481.1 hypothetical protein [Candidatus Magasanikbacteria bacterium]MBT4547313.1 hypothetical protein [Candidatus Magasanikbacteria bacterium]MBT6818918.1 hypothetical protein [Candidatus Magasanikbacteria bacterium]
MTNKTINKKRMLHFLLPEDQSLFDYDYIFSASALWAELDMENVTATFDLTVRDLPRNRNFLVFNGLEEMLTGILSWNFTKEDVSFLLKRKIITKKFAKLLSNFKFDGDVWAMPEGSIFFQGESVLRITGKLWQINLFTFFLINSLTSNVVFSSKLARCFLAAGGKTYVATCPPVRGHAHEASLKFGRSAYLFGSASGMVPAFARKFDIPYESKARGFHAFIKSFPYELTAMRELARVFPDASLMVDTYGFESGVDNAIKVALEQKSNNKPVFSAIFIDSGKDVEEFSDRAKYARKKMDRAGLKSIQITVAGNFDEYKIKKLVDLKAPVDKVILGTEAITPADDPKLETVLKMSQFVKEGKITNTAKLSKGKSSYPGIKQVFRKYNKNGQMVEDTIGLHNEKLGGALLKQYIKRGKLSRKLPSIDEIKKYQEKEFKTLSPKLKKIDKSAGYIVKNSKKLEKLMLEVSKKHL